MSLETPSEGKPWDMWAESDREKVTSLARAFLLSAPGEPVILDSETDEGTVIQGVNLLWLRRLIYKGYEGEFDPTISVGLMDGIMDATEIAAAKVALEFSRERCGTVRDFRRLILAHAF